MRKIIVFLLIGILMILFISLNISFDQALSNDLHEYYRLNYISDTGAENAVTAIYLNYRVYDTIFEALMLLISVFAIIYFSRYKGGV